MKRLLLLLVSVFLLFSCSTTIEVPYMQPSIIDMGGYRNLAVASVVPYRGYVAPTYVVGADIQVAGFHIFSGYTASTADNIASYATDELVSTLSSTEFFNILPPEITDGIIERGRFGGDISKDFKSMGYDAVLIPRITGMSVSETLYSKPYEDWWVDEDGNRHSRIEFNYYYKQVASIDYTITLIDTESGRIIGQRTFSDTETREDVLDRRWSHLNDVSYLFRRMISSFDYSIIRLLVPTVHVSSVSLMKNKPEDENADKAYDAAKDGNLDLAREVFLEEWQNAKHLPSGYNAALLIAATGDYDDAISLLGEVTSVYSDEKSRNLYRDLLSIRSRNEQAMGQVSGESSIHQTSSSSGNDIYALVMGI